MDRMEKMIADALDFAGIPYQTDMQGNPSGLDFRLPNGVEIEVKQFHSPRIADQMARTQNVIAVQGEAAIGMLAILIRAFSQAHGRTPL